MSKRNPKGAALEQSHYESPEIVDCFSGITEPLCLELKSQQCDLSLTAQDLSLLIGQLQQFQQDCLGAFNRPSNAPLRIPAKLLKVEKNTTLTKESPIYTILFGAYSYRLKHAWKKWDFTNPAKKQRNAELIQFVRNLLIKSNFITVPKIAIMEPVNDLHHKTVVSLIKKIGAIYVEDKNEATHILYGKQHKYNKDGPEEDWFRTLEKKEDMVLVHWWYYPDSFDSWLPQTEQFADPEEPPEHIGPWKISVRWLQDTIRFNEIMNEEDYEDIDEDDDDDEEEEEEDEEEEEETEYEITSDMSRKRKRSIPESVSHIPRKRTPSDAENSITTKLLADQISEDHSNKEVIPMQSQFDTNQHQQEQLQQQEPSEPSVPVVNSGNQPEVRIRDIESERPQTGSRQRKNEFEPYLNGDISNISQFTAANVEYPKRYTKLQKPNEEDNDQKALDIPSLVKPTPFNYEEIRLPEWFDKSSIHEIEFLSLPEIDKEESLSAEEYKIYRNYMVDTYMSNLDYYLTISACKSKLDADLVTLTRIHHFLEMNKVINFKTDPRRRIFDPYIDSDPSAQVNPKSQRNFKDIDKADIQYLRELIYNGAETNSTRSSWDLSIEDPNNPDRRKIFHCSNCKVECSEVRYQSLKSKNYQICIDCFLEGRFPATFFSGDFLRVESANGPDLEMDEVWTDEEILRLLEGVDRFDDDWLMISEHVGSRSKEQCITQFLQLPINDEFLTAKLSKKELEELPFGDLPNPIMAMIAFLSGHINPGIGAAAAKAALKELIKSGEGGAEPIEVKQTIKKENSTSEQPVEHVDTEIVDVIKEEEEEVNIENKEIDQGAFSREVLRRAATNALKSSVECAHKLASYEEQEIQHWTRLAVKTIIDKLSIKVQQYDEIDTSLASESNDLEKQKNILAGSIEALVGQSFPLQGSEEAASSLHQS